MAGLYYRDSIDKIDKTETTIEEPIYKIEEVLGEVEKNDTNNNTEEIQTEGSEDIDSASEPEPDGADGDISWKYISSNYQITILNCSSGDKDKIIRICNDLNLNYEVKKT